MRWMVLSLAALLGLLTAWPVARSAESLVGAASPVADIVAQTDGQGDPTRGAQVFDAHCDACHGSGGTGAVGPPIALTSLSQAEVMDLVANGRRARADGTGGMPAFGAVLTDGELRDLSAYVITLARRGSSAQLDESDGVERRVSFGREALLIALLVVIVGGGIAIAVRKR